MPQAAAVIAIDVATAVVVAVDLAIEYGAYIAAASAVYQNVAASEAQRRARNQARDRYNAALTDRTVSYTSAESPWKIPYGEVTTGGRVVAQLTYGDRDQYQAVVVVWADCECDAIVDVQLNGESLGTLDSEGRVTSGRWTKENADTPSDTLDFDGAGQATLARPAAQLVSISYTQQVLHDNGMTGEANSSWWVEEDVVVPVASLSISGQVVTHAPAAGRTARANYASNTLTPYVRVRHHLGTMGQAADAYLLATVPSIYWGPSMRLAGKCYSIFEFNLDHAELQAGPPKTTVRLRGKKVFDHRTGTTAWSPNVALCTVDYLRAEYGKAQPDHTIDWASWDAAANVCDEALASHSGAARYRCDGVVDTSSDSDQVLQQLTGAMAGAAVYQGVWYGVAGAYTTPVMDLTAADNAGSVEVVGTPQGLEVFNGLRGQFYDRDRFDQLTDYTPYQNAGFKAVDGADWWGPLNLPFTSENWRAHNLARIEVERSRGMTVLFPAKRRAVKLRPGQRVRLSVPQLGLSLAIFRVVKKEYRPGTAVLLTLVQDDPSFWDEADAPAPLASPAANVLDPFTVAAPLGFAVASSPSVALYDSDGSVISRARATWLPPDDGLVQQGGALQMELRLAESDTWQRLPEVGPSATQVQLPGLQDQRLYAVRARWRNSWGHVSDWRAQWVVTNVPAATRSFSTVVPIYQRAASSPALPSAAATYNVDTGVISGLNNGWQATPPAGTSPLYTSSALVRSAGGGTASVPASAWGLAVRLTGEQGPQGDPGPPGAGAINWVATSNVAATGNALIASSASPQPAAYSVESYLGGAQVSCRYADTSAGDCRIALQQAPTLATSTWGAADYAMEWNGSTGLLTAFYGDYAVGSLPPVAPGDVLALRYDGTAVRFLVNGIERASAGSGLNQLYHAKVEASGACSIPDITFVQVAVPGTAGASVEVQYSADGSTAWHSSFTAGDVYMRQRVGYGSFSAAIRIVGEQGLQGNTGNFIDHVFRRATSQPATPTGHGTPAGWSDDPPAGADPLWMATAEKTAANTLVGSWAAPVRITGEAGTNGTNGVDGVDGMDGADGASLEVQYSADGSSWHPSFAGGDVYMRQRVGAAGGYSAAIRIVGERGNDGGTGNFIDVVFMRALAQPPTPTGNGTPSGWHDAPPAGTEPLWMTTAEKTAANMLVGTWATPARLTGDTGSTGQKGDTGDTGPAGASVEVQYSTDASSWHPSFAGGDLYMRQRVGTGAWSAAMRVVGEQGATGGTGNFIDYVFKRATSQPATPTGSSTPSGWSDDPPAGTEPLWMATAEKTAANVLVGAWAAPVRITGEQGTAGANSVLYAVTFSDATGVSFSNFG